MGGASEIFRHTVRRPPRGTQASPPGSRGAVTAVRRRRGACVWFGLSRQRMESRTCAEGPGDGRTSAPSKQEAALGSALLRLRAGLLGWLVGDGARSVLESCSEILRGGVSPEVGARVCPNALLPGCVHGEGVRPAQTVPLLGPPLPTSPLLLGRLPGPASQQTLPLLRLGLPGGKGTLSPKQSCAF